MTDGFSGADITSVVNTAVSLVLQEYIAAYPKPEDAKQHAAEAVVTMKHFEDAIRKVKTSREGKPVERLQFRTTGKPREEEIEQAHKP